MRRAAAALGGIAVGLLAPEVLAQDGGERQPVAFVARPLTLPEMTLRADGSFAIIRYGFGSGSFSFSETFVHLTFGGAFGVTDDFEVSAQVIPLAVAPDFQYGNPELGATYRFLEGDVEMGARLEVSIPVASDRYFGLFPGLPMLFRLGDAARLDTGVSFGLLVPVESGGFGLRRETQIGLFGSFLSVFALEPGVPLRFTFQPVPEFFLGPRTGFGLLDFERAGDTFFIPLGMSAGGTIPGDGGPLADITGNFDFPLLFLPGAGDKVTTELYSFGVSANFYFNL